MYCRRWKKVQIQCLVKFRWWWLKTIFYSNIIILLSFTGNHAHSGWFPIVRREAQRFACANHHPRVDGWVGKARSSTCRWLGRCRRGVGSTRKLGDDRISAGAHSTYDSITVLLRKYRVGIHVHILHLQIFTRDDSQNNEVDLGKQVQIINSFAIPLLFLFHQCPKYKSWILKLDCTIYVVS